MNKTTSAAAPIPLHEQDSDPTHAMISSANRSTGLDRRSLAPAKPSRAYEQTKQRVEALKVRGVARREILATAKRIDVTSAVAIQASENLREVQRQVGGNLVAGVKDMQWVEQQLADDPSFDPELWAVAKSDVVATSVQLIQDTGERTRRLLRELDALTDDVDLWEEPTLGEAAEAVLEGLASGLSFGASELDNTKYELTVPEVFANYLTLGHIADKRRRQLRADEETRRSVRRRAAGLEPDSNDGEVIDADYR